MSRWQPESRERLQQAALELFSQQGFAATTVPEITARAGLTTRTFFRHFADKREVLFAGDEIPELASRLISHAPGDLDPGTLILRGLRTVAETRFDPRRSEVRQWREIIRSDQGLRERDLQKRAALSQAIHGGLVGRGVDPVSATLFAELGVALFQVALERWLDAETGPTLFEVVLETLGSMRTTLTAFPSEVPAA